MGVCNCSIFCCTLLYVHSSIAIILMGKRELIDLLNLSSWCLVMVERLFLAVPWGCLQFVIVVFPDHTHLLFFTIKYRYSIFRFTTFFVECCNCLFCCNQTCYCVDMVSVTSASRYQSRPWIYVRGLIPRNWSMHFRL